MNVGFGGTPAAADVGAMLELARRHRKEGRPAEAAAVYDDAAAALAAGGDRFGVVAAQAWRARSLLAAGRRDDALRVLAEADRAAASFPAGRDDAGKKAAEARAILDSEAAHILVQEDRLPEAMHRAFAAELGFRTIKDRERAEPAALFAAKLAIAVSGPRAAERSVRKLLATMTPDGKAHRKVSKLLAGLGHGAPPPSDGPAPAPWQPPAPAAQPASPAPPAPSSGPSPGVADPEGKRLITAPDPGIRGSLLFGLACGAHVAVRFDIPWNSLSERYHDRRATRELLEDNWRITDQASWHRVMEAMLEGTHNDNLIELVFTLRERAWPIVRLAEWQGAIGHHCRDHRLPETDVTRMMEVSERIMRYEERFRSDGLLQWGERVQTGRAFDFGRAVNVARWGLVAGYCSEPTAELCVERAGENSRHYYRSWGAYYAGYAMVMTVRRYDERLLEEQYASALRLHRTLAEDPAGPWRTLPWG